MSNEEQREYWNSEESRHWVSEQAIHDGMLERFGARVIEAAAPTPDERVLDIGCGCGATTFAAARATVSGLALGVDVSEPMLTVARDQARREGVENAQFQAADAQSHPFEANAFDVAISRFGVMFFADPVAAFANIRRALRLDGRVVFVCWKERLENEWLTVPGAAIVQHVPPPPQGPPDAPGPFAFADGERVRSILTAAGFTDVTLDAAHEPILYAGLDASGVVEFIHNTGMGRSLLGNAAPAVVERALAAARDALMPYETPEGLRISGTSWIVQARAGASAR